LFTIYMELYGNNKDEKEEKEIKTLNIFCYVEQTNFKTIHIYIHIYCNVSQSVTCDNYHYKKLHTNNNTLSHPHTTLTLTCTHLIAQADS
jgi:hypothetical protein